MSEFQTVHADRRDATRLARIVHSRPPDGRARAIGAGRLIYASRDGLFAATDSSRPDPAAHREQMLAASSPTKH